MQCVSDSFNMTSRDEDNILDQIYQSKYVRISIDMILVFLKHYTKMHANIKTQFLSSLLLCARCISLNMNILQSLTLYTMLKLSKTTTPQKLFPSDHLCWHYLWRLSRHIIFSGILVFQYWRRGKTDMIKIYPLEGVDFRFYFLN